MELKAATTAPLLLQQGYLKVIEDGSVAEGDAIVLS